MLVTPTIQAASIGIPDTMFLMVLALIVFGPRRLPEIGRQIGKLMYEFRKVSNEFKFQMEEELRASEEAARQEKLQQASRGTAELPAPVQFATGTDTVAVSEHDVKAGLVEAAYADANDNSEVYPPVVSEDLAVSGEVRGEPRRFPQIQPPSSGEIVHAEKPFRGRIEEPAVVASDSETVTESGDAAIHTVSSPVVVADEGRIGTEVQPGVIREREELPAARTERETNHV